MPREDDLNMLRTLLASTNIERHDKEAFENMYDWLFRGRRTLTPKQRAWVEKVYHKLGTNRPKLQRHRAAVNPKMSPEERKLMESLRSRKRVKGGV
jgi:hypothetical protein